MGHPHMIKEILYPPPEPPHPLSCWPGCEPPSGSPPPNYWTSPVLGVIEGIQGGGEPLGRRGAPRGAGGESATGLAGLSGGSPVRPRGNSGGPRHLASRASTSLRGKKPATTTATRVAPSPSSSCTRISSEAQQAISSHLNIKHRLRCESAFFRSLVSGPACREPQTQARARIADDC